MCALEAEDALKPGAGLLDIGNADEWLGEHDYVS